MFSYSLYVRVSNSIMYVYACTLSFGPVDFQREHVVTGKLDGGHGFGFAALPSVRRPFVFDHYCELIAGHRFLHGFRCFCEQHIKRYTMKKRWSLITNTLYIHHKKISTRFQHLFTLTCVNHQEKPYTHYCHQRIEK